MDEILQIALVGTGKKSAESAPAANSAEELVTLAAVERTEKKLLLRAGASKVYLAAGQLPHAASALPEPARSEDRPVCSSRAVEVFRDLYASAGAEPDLLLEALRLLDECGFVLPPVLLPVAMDQARGEIRKAVLPVIGERGRWLAGFNDDWQWVRNAASGVTAADRLPENADQLWLEGNSGTRRQLLENARRIDPARGRQWLASVWSAEKADQRLAFIAMLATGVSDEDIPFLEEALMDRSGNVRAKAADLLARLPNSGLAQRMRQRGAAMLHYTPPKKRGTLAGAVGAILGKKQDVGQLEVTPPKTFDKEWAKDAIEEKPPAGIGERAHWLKQVLQRVPPSHWAERFGASHVELIAAATASDYDQPLLEAWSEAAFQAPEADWISSLWDWWFTHPVKKPEANQLRIQWLSRMLAEMPAAEAEERILRLVTDESLGKSLPTAELAAALPRPWNAKIGKALLSWLRNEAKTALDSQRPGYGDWLQVLDTAGKCLPAECLPEALVGWPESTGDDYASRFVNQQLHHFQTTITLRRRFRELLQSSS